MYKLYIELVPRPLWGVNLRNYLGKEKWRDLSKKVAKDAGYRCEVCGGRGPKHPVECHEIWDYSVWGTQKLKGFIALCPDCHKIKHWGRTQLFSDEAELSRLIGHFCNINGVTENHFAMHKTEAFAWWQRANKIDWESDFQSVVNGWIAQR